MQAVFETIFDAVYLSLVICLGISMIEKANGNKITKLFGIMALTLGVGDSFHLLPRAYSLLTNALFQNHMLLGFGKMITSITMTVFYVLLYEIARHKYGLKCKYLRISIYALAFVRIILCLLPGNEWLSANPSLLMGILRNIPFAIMGALIIVLFYKKASETSDKHFKYMWLAILLSFAFYIPVVLLSASVPLIGLLMVPKTLAYVWVVYMGYQYAKE